MNPSRLSWKIISRLSDQMFNANHLIFTGYGISTLQIACSPVKSSKAQIESSKYKVNLSERA